MRGSALLRSVNSSLGELVRDERHSTLSNVRSKKAASNSSPKTGEVQAYGFEQLRRKHRKRASRGAVAVIATLAQPYGQAATSGS